MFKRIVIAAAVVVRRLDFHRRAEPSRFPRPPPRPQRARRGQAKKAYVVPKTPWGDPDLQGNYTNKYEQGTPFERPAEFEGKRVEDIQGKELADVDPAAAAAGDRARAVSLRRSDRHDRRADGVPRHLRGQQGLAPWFVTDPTDGKIPPITPEGQQRIAARPRTGSSFSNGVYDSYENLSLYDRCITRGYPSSMLPAIYGDSYQIVQGQGFVAIRIEMIHETRVIPLGNQPHVSKGIALDMGDPAATGKATRWSSRRRTSGTAASTATAIRRRCGWSSASPASRLRRSSGPSRSTIRRPGRGRGRSRCR